MIDNLITNTINDVQLMLTQSYKKLKSAIVNEQLEQISSICMKRPRILTAPLDRSGNAPLAYAIKNGAYKSAETLLRCGADVDVGNIAKGTCPLNMVVRQETNEEEIPKIKNFIDLLIKQNCQIDFTRTYSETSRDGVPFYVEITSLMDAISLERMVIIEQLLQNGANVNFTCQFSGTSPFLWSITTGNTAVFDLLIQRGANVTHKSRDGSSAIHWLSSCEREGETNFKHMINRLIEMGCNINELNQVGQTPLMVAISKSVCKLVDLILEKNPNLTITDSFGFNARDYAIHMDCSHCVIAVEEAERAATTDL